MHGCPFCPLSTKSTAKTSQWPCHLLKTRPDHLWLRGPGCLLPSDYNYFLSNLMGSTSLCLVIVSDVILDYYLNRCAVIWLCTLFITQLPKKLSECKWLHFILFPFLSFFFLPHSSLPQTTTCAFQVYHSAVHLGNSCTHLLFCNLKFILHSALRNFRS